MSSIASKYQTVAVSMLLKKLKPKTFSLRTRPLDENDESTVEISAAASTLLEGTNQRGILLLHGLASNRKMWEECAENLVQLKYHVISLDLRGMGESHNSAFLDDEYNLNSYACDIAEIIKQIKTEYGSIWSNPIVAGQSWGGSLALFMASRYPHDIVSAVICVDGGYIDLQGSFPDWEDCEKALRPPGNPCPNPCPVLRQY